MNEIGADSERVLALVPITVLKGYESEVDLNIALYPSGGGETKFLPILSVEALKASETKDLLIIEIDITDVEPGEYELEIETLNTETSTRSSVRKLITRR